MLFRSPKLVSSKTAEEEIERRRKTFGIVIDTKDTYVYDDKAQELWDMYAEEQADTDKDVKELSGIVASVGKETKIKGQVRIVIDPKKIKDFLKGDVLVAPMTSPDYVFLMKLCSAIVTDTGGLTSHAAIVSRELHKPCIIGTKIATKVLKDGDLVEVDTNNGTIKILKNN